MKNYLKINPKTAFIIYIILDTVLVGMGMGVPFFCILFGFPMGWYLVKRIYLTKRNLNKILKPILKYAALTSSFTLILMIIVWGPVTTLLLNPAADIANFGIPMILFDPKISFIGWIILMIFVSPFLQLLVTIFAANIAIIKYSKREVKNVNSERSV
jgi:hypothetical protein